MNPTGNRLRAGLVGVAILLLPSCGSESDHPPLNPVEGTVTWRGKPADGATVIFHPRNEVASSAPRPNASVASDGTFRLGTYATGDGAPAGEYGVTIEWPVAGKPLDPPGPDRLGRRYANQQQPAWTINVRQGPNNLEPFVLE